MTRLELLEMSNKALSAKLNKVMKNNKNLRLKVKRLRNKLVKHINEK